MPPANGYSHVVTFSGRSVAVSGQLPLDSQGRLVGPGDPAAQVRKVFENISAGLAAAGAGIEDLVMITVYLTDLADLDTFRRVRDEYLSPERPPASSLVQVSGLVTPGARVEIDALAVL
jgi:enamine deaminase RidA (YjgF/YER057c/UK114 family)